MSETELPEGWAGVQLGDVVVLNYGKGLTTQTRREGPVPVYGSNGVVGHHDEALTDAEVVVVGRKGSIGAVHLSGGPCWPIDTTYYVNDFSVLEPEYLVHLLRALNLERLDTSTAIPGLNREDAYSLDVAVPPKAEQERIVGAAEALLARVHAVRDRLDRVPAILRRFRQSVLAAACDGRLTEDWRAAHPDVETADVLLGRIEEERRARLGKKYKAPAKPETDDLDDLPEGWAWARADQIGAVALGGTPARSEAAYWDGDLKWLGSGEVANCLIRDSKERITEEGLNSSSAKLYPPGTVLIAMIGEGKTRGQSALLEVEAATNQNVAAIIPQTPGVVPRYVWRWALSNYESHRSEGQGGAQYALNKGKVSAFTLPLPPTLEQTEIVRRADALLALADRVEARVEVARQHADRTAQAVLAKAFRGELVPTEAELARADGRDYETADALLARVAADAKATKAAPQPKTPPARTDAPDLFDPPPAASASGEVPGLLRHAAETGVATTPRELLLWFGQKRRGAVVVGRVRSALDELGIETQPDFAEAGYDDPIRLVRR